MKPSVLIISNVLKKESFVGNFWEKYELVVVREFLTSEKAFKKGSIDICFVHVQHMKQSDFLFLKRILKMEGTVDFLVALEKSKVSKILEILGEREDYLVIPYSLIELKLKFDRMLARRVLERENHFWRVELAALLADRETLKREDIPTDIWDKAKEGRVKEGQSFKRSRKEFERQCLKQALERARGSQTQAAKALGIHRNTLIWKLKRLNLEEDYQKIVRKRRQR